VVKPKGSKAKYEKEINLKKNYKRGTDFDYTVCIYAYYSGKCGKRAENGI